jgi:hypothetical protein
MPLTLADRAWKFDSRVDCVAVAGRDGKALMRGTISEGYYPKALRCGSFANGVLQCAPSRFSPSNSSRNSSAPITKHNGAVQAAPSMRSRKETAIWIRIATRREP